MAAPAAAAGGGVAAGLPLQLLAALPDSPLGIVQLLQIASDAAASKPAPSNAAAGQGYQAGSGPFSFSTPAGRYEVRDQLPTQVTEVTGQLGVPPVAAFPHKLLAFHNRCLAKGAAQFLRPQPSVGSTGRPLFRLGGPEGQLVEVSLAYDPPGKQKVNPQGNGDLGIVTSRYLVQVKFKPASALRTNLRKLSEVRVVQHLVVRKVGEDNPHSAPYWRAWERGKEVGCVALYEFPGNLELQPAEMLFAQGAHAAALPAAPVPPPAAAPLAAPVPPPAAAPLAAAAPPAAGIGPAAGGPPYPADLQLPAPGQHVAGPAPMAHMPQQQPWRPPRFVAAQADTGPPAGTAAAAAAAEVVAGAATPGIDASPGLRLVSGQQPGADAGGESLASLYHTFQAGPVLPLPASFVGDMLLSPIISDADGEEGEEEGGEEAERGVEEGEEAERGENEGEEEGEEEEALEVDLHGPPVPSSPTTQLLLGTDDEMVMLQHLLLKLAAGMYGSRSADMLQAELCPRWRRYNVERQASGRPPLSIADVREGWFLQRSVLHLLVSQVRVWGPGGDEKPPEPAGLDGAARKQLLDMLCSDSQQLRALLRSVNRNKATPLFTACHFCNPAALAWLLSRQELTFRTMLFRTKRGKLFYHMISTQYHIAAQPQERQRLSQGMVLVLTALADRVKRWLGKLTPQQQQRWQDKVVLRQQERRQRHQGRLHAEAAGRGEHGGALAVTSPSQAVAEQPAAAVGALQPAVQQLHGPAAAAGLQAATAAVATATANRAAAAAAAAAGSSEQSHFPERLNLSEEVLWWLANYAIFHTEWHSSRSMSPAYDGALLDEMVQALYGFRPRQWYE